MKNFKQLKIWQSGQKIAVKVYRLSMILERQASFTFSSQITRAALSIPSNIAEGSSRRSEKDYFRFLEYAQGSAFELETQLEVMLELGLAKDSDISEIISLINETQKMIYGLMKTLNR